MSKGIVFLLRCSLGFKVYWNTNSTKVCTVARICIPLVVFSKSRAILLLFGSPRDTPLDRRNWFHVQNHVFKDNLTLVRSAV